MTVTRLEIVTSAADIPAARDDTLVLVLDPAWTPRPGERDDLVIGRRRFGAVVERVDLFDGALDLVDRWAEATAIADRLQVEGVTYWFRMRETMWRWLHERLLCRHVLAGLGLSEEVAEVVVPADEAAFADVAARMWPGAVRIVGAATEAETDADAAPRATATGGATASATTTAATAQATAQATAAARPTAAPPPPASPRPAAAWRRALRSVVAKARPGSRPGSATPPPGSPGAERARREVVLAERVADLVAEPRPRVLVLTNPATHQRVGAAGGDRRDPLFGAVIPGLADAGLSPVLLATGIDHRRDEDWPLVEADDRLLPQFLLRTRWSRPEDDARADAAVADLEAAVEAVRIAPLDIDGIDLGPAFVEALGSAAAHVIRTDAHVRARAERLIDELEPRAVVLAQEGIRTPWLAAGRAAGIPVMAVQHGVLYAGHAGYPNRRHPALCLPTRTFAYGPFERDVLLGLAYREDEVEVSGSPRLDLDTAPPGPDALARERRAVRAELGVAEGDRLLVVSTVNLRFVQRSHFAWMLEAVLGGPLPGVHVVCKQHPGEHDAGPYRDLLHGLAAAGGWTPPPISVVQDVDLYRLLRAADAHLGLLSTVLTDAVAAGTPNLIALTDRHADLLGYVEAGVARPVRSPAELLAALDDPRPADPEARAAFLARHFRDGDASARIVEAVREAAASGAGEPWGRATAGARR